MKTIETIYFIESLKDLTELETAALRSAFESSLGNGHDFGYTDDITIEGQSKKAVGGVISSLIKKKIIVRDDEFGQFAFLTFGDGKYEAAEAVIAHVEKQ